MGRKKKRLRLLAAQEKARQAKGVAAPSAPKAPESAAAAAPTPKKKGFLKKSSKSRTKKA